MPESFETRYVKGGYAVAEELVLSETRTTRVVFRPGLHARGVRGYLIRQKRGKDGSWKDVNEVNFRHMPPDSGVTIELSTDAIEKLFLRIAHLYEVSDHGIIMGDQRYIVARDDEAVIINDQTKATAIRALLDQGYSEDFWQELSRSNPDLATKFAAAQIEMSRQYVLLRFRNGLATFPHDENAWQMFFQQNPWLLQAAFSSPVIFLAGETYLGGKQAIGRQGQGGVATDFLFSDEGTNSFAVIDIKTPDATLMGSQYRGRKGSDQAGAIYTAHPDLTGGVIQVRNQITVAIEHFQTTVGATYPVTNRIHPRGVLIAGTASSLSERQKASFNEFRNALHGITVITFDELLRRLELMLDINTGRPAAE